MDFNGRKRYMIQFLKSKYLIGAFVLSFIQMLLSLFTDRYVFSDPIPSVRYSVLKAAFFIILLVLWYFVLKLVKHILKKEKKYICFLLVFLAFLVIYTSIMILIWPGNWRWDERSILGHAVCLELFPWQHIFTSLFYIFSLMVFPSPFMIVMVQYGIIAAIIAYFVGTLYLRYGWKALFSGILFLFPSVVAHVFYPMRLILFAFVELLFLFILFQKRKEKRLGYKSLAFLSLLNVILAVWRTECIFFIAFMPLYLFFKKYPKKIMALFSSAVIVFFGFSFLVQNHFMKAGGNSVAYKVTGIAYPFTYLLKEEYKRSPESQTLDRISKYVDIEKAVTYVNGDAAFWDGVYDNIKTDEQFNAMVMDLLDLVKNNPKEFLKERLSNFDKTSQVADEYGDLKYMRGSLNIFNFDRYLIASPIDVQLRVSVLKLLNANSGILFIDHLSLWTYNLYIPLILLIVMWMIGIVRRKQNKMLLLITSFLLVQFTAIFVTAPGSRFMYYFPVFICSYGLFLSCFPEKARCYLQKRKMEN